MGFDFSWIKMWLKQMQSPRPSVSEHDRVVITRPQSLPADQINALGFDVSAGWLRPSPYFDTSIFQLYRFIRDNIPDVSAGVWAWTCLCSTPHWVEYNGGEEEDQARAAEIISALDRRLFPYPHQKEAGMDAVIERYFRSVFTYGAFALEAVLSRRRNQLTKVVFIDPSTIRFKRVKGSHNLIPYQVPPGFSGGLSLQSLIDKGKAIELNPNTFYYYGLGADNDNPYGTSILSSIPFVSRIQNKMVADMQATMHNAGYPRYHVRYTPPKQNIGESNDDYKKRIESNFGKLQSEFSSLPPDSNFISYDNVEIIVKDASGKISIEWYNNHRAVTEQVISGMKLAPFMIGKNYGTTETWGTAQYDLMLRNARMVQRGAKRMAEWLRNLELMLAGSPVRSEHHFSENRAAGEQIEAQAEAIKMRTTQGMLDEGLISQQQAARRMGLQKPFVEGPNISRLAIKAKYKFASKKIEVEMEHKTTKESEEGDEEE